ncbi:hypothetical protein [Ktedonobacter racemifer]|uniref:hypothetical protein n=1 Tax=Ktedonobacter racemifer TaxID=363277 RepID=UPI001FCAD0D9|nr:hypothetical protein [Ktedonobacter racemifer]
MPSNHACFHEKPGAMTDRAHWLVGREEIAHELHGICVDARCRSGLHVPPGRTGAS